MSTVKQYRPIINTSIQLAFENFLKEFKFETFITITFRKRLQVDTIKKLLRSYLAHINDNYVSFYDKSLFAYIFVEKNSFDSSSHVHLLVKNLKPEHYFLLEQMLNESFGHSQIKPCHENSIPYIAKKYTTDRLLTYDPMRINSRQRKRLNDNAEIVSNEVLLLSND